MIKKERSLVSKSSNSLNATIKRSSVTINNSHLKKITFIATAIILLSVTATFGFSPNEDVFAKKPQRAIEWSNGFPSGEHANLNIHGKKLDPFYNCDNTVASEPFGKSIFVPIEGTSKIEFVSNKRASGFNILQVLDPCADPFGQDNPTDAALVQLESEEMQVYWRILGKPNNGNSPSAVMLTFPTLIAACNFLPTEFEDGSVVNSFDPDVGLGLVAFTADEKHTEDVAVNGMFDVGESIYLDEGDGMVGPGDVLLAGPGVADGVGLVAFTAFEQHENDTGANPGFDVDETVYLSADAVVSEGDTRLANASSQGLDDTEGGDAIDCSEDTLVGLGLISKNGVFKQTKFGLERFEDPEPVKGKGKSKAIEITDLFTWSGALCDASLDTVAPFGVLTPEDFGETDASIAAITGDFVLPLTDEEFTEFLGTVDGCQVFSEEWIFIIADIVRYGLDYENDGTTLTQMRFYPTASTTFD